MNDEQTGEQRGQGGENRRRQRDGFTGSRRMHIQRLDHFRRLFLERLGRFDRGGDVLAELVQRRHLAAGAIRPNVFDESETNPQAA